MAALPADLQAAFSVLRAEEKENRTTSNNKPNIFESEGRDEHANRRVAIETSKENETELRKGLAKPNDETGLAAQMSHLWIKQCLKKPVEKLTTKGKELKGLIKQWEDGDIDTYPYNRWIFLVTGRQLHKHRQSGGSAHDIQTVLSIPDNILAD